MDKKEEFSFRIKRVKTDRMNKECDLTALIINEYGIIEGVNCAKCIHYHEISRPLCLNRWFQRYLR